MMFHRLNYICYLTKAQSNKKKKKKILVIIAALKVQQFPLLHTQNYHTISQSFKLTSCLPQNKLNMKTTILKFKFQYFRNTIKLILYTFCSLLYWIHKLLIYCCNS